MNNDINNKIDDGKDEAISSIVIGIIFLSFILYILFYSTNDNEFLLSIFIPYIPLFIPVYVCYNRASSSIVKYNNYNGERSKTRNTLNSIAIIIKVISFIYLYAPVPIIFFIIASSFFN
jgi:uncharacterized membrane protein